MRGGLPHTSEDEAPQIEQSSQLGAPRAFQFDKARQAQTTNAHADSVSHAIRHRLNEGRGDRREMCCTICVAGDGR